VDGALTGIAPIRPLQLCADGGYQLRLGVLGVRLIMVPDTSCFKIILDKEVVADVQFVESHTRQRVRRVFSRLCCIGAIFLFPKVLLSSSINHIVYMCIFIYQFKNVYTLILYKTLQILLLDFFQNITFFNVLL
jgi:hypothetical protein